MCTLPDVASGAYTAQECWFVRPNPCEFFLQQRRGSRPATLLQGRFIHFRLEGSAFCETGFEAWGVVFAEVERGYIPGFDSVFVQESR
jgi:hypothetical protein